MNEHLLMDFWGSVIVYSAHLNEQKPLNTTTVQHVE